MTSTVRRSATEARQHMPLAPKIKPKSTTTKTHRIEILPLSNSSDLTAAADVLADAFMFGNPNPTNPNGKGVADPFYDRLHNGVEKVHHLFHCIIDLASKKNHTIAVVRDQKKRIVGVSWVKERNVKDINILDFPKLVMPAIRAFGFLDALRYGWDVLNHIPVYPDNITYISMVGVAKSSQGKGIGPALINEAIRRANGKDVALSTMNPRNIKLYERLGFALQPEKQTETKTCKERPGFTTFHMAYKPRGYKE